MTSMTYRSAGVDIDAGDALVERIKPLARATARAGVLGGIGGFGALFDPRAGGFTDPILVATTDGVGTKLKLAIETGRHATVGIDLVAMCVNDLVVQGAEPLFFLDYFATGKLDVTQAATVIAGIAEGCRQARCALVGGETAEMPGFYPPDEYDLAGCIVGWVRRKRILDGGAIRPGDVVLGLPSLGLHTNGYSLARKVLLEQEGLHLTEHIPELSRTLGDELLAPHLCYWPAVQPLLAHGWLKGLVHITGGGITDNTPRVLPEGAQAEIRLGSWPVLPIFDLIAKCGNVPRDDMLRTFNMGLGLLLIVSPRCLARVTSALKKRREKFWTVGRIVRGRRGVKYLEA
jgi:phosphoribosylformylglycinamidine cyclo-ligase